MAYTLRNYQADALTAIDNYFARAKGNPVVSMATGTGKSIVIAEFCKRALTVWPETRIIMLVHVRELVKQNADTLQALWPEAPLGIYAASFGRREVRPITFCSVQSMYDQAHKFGLVDLVLIDEAHRTPSKGEGMYRTLLADLLKANPKTKAIGFTATPYRLDSGRLTDPGGIFTDLVYETDLLQMIRDGWLCTLVSHTVKDEAQINTDLIPIQAGEFSANAMQQAALSVVDAAVKEIIKLGAKRSRWLLFSSGVDHGFDVAGRLTDAGVEARMIEGGTPKEQRDEIVRDFREGRLRALVNCGVFTEGFDVPQVDMVVLLRATCSPGLLVQMVGRGLRKAEGKRDCLVLDFGGNFERHGPLNAIRPRRRRADGTLDKPEPVQPRVCFVCGHQEVVKSLACENCETPWPKSQPSHGEKPSTADPIFEPQDLAVMGLAYTRHISKKEGKPDSMVASYHTVNGWVDEWICFEHTGYAKQKAAQWWGRRAQLPIPETVAEALERVDELRHPEKVRVGMEGSFFRILAYYWFADATKERQVRDAWTARRKEIEAKEQEEREKIRRLLGMSDEIPF